MKRKQIPTNIDITQPVEVVVDMPGINRAFVIRGDYEDVVGYYKPSKAPRRAIKAKAVNVMTTAQKEATALVYDRIHKTNFHKQLRLQRQYKRNAAMAGKLGLV